MVLLGQNEFWEIKKTYGNFIKPIFNKKILNISNLSAHISSISDFNILFALKNCKQDIKI